MSITDGRMAFLKLGAYVVPLDNPDGGWACTELDLGYPDVREVKDPNPIAHGLIDRTQFFGERTITAKITAFPGGSMPLDAIYEQFGPFLDVAQRPELHFTTIGNAVERVLILRATQWSAPMDVPNERQFQLAWYATDPVASGAAVYIIDAWAGASAGAGRAYDLNFNRTYPATGGAPASGVIVTSGSAPVQPLLRVYGPVTGAAIAFMTAINGVASLVPFLATARIDAGHFVEVDTKAHTAYYDGDRSQSWLNQLDWTRMAWPVLPVNPDQTTMSMTGANTSGLTQVQAGWKDRYFM